MDRRIQGRLLGGAGVGVVGVVVRVTGSSALVSSRACRSRSCRRCRYLGRSLRLFCVSRCVTVREDGWMEEKRENVRCG